MALGMSAREEALASRMAQQGFRLALRDRDIGLLADLWVEGWQAVFPTIDFAARRDWFCVLVANMEADGASTICALDDKNVLGGFILLHRARCYVEQLAVRPALFGSRVAMLLIDEAKRLCPDGLDLHVNEDNRRALRLYEKAGFQRREAGLNPNSGLKTWHMHWR